MKKGDRPISPETNQSISKQKETHRFVRHLGFLENAWSWGLPRKGGVLLDQRSWPVPPPAGYRARTTGAPSHLAGRGIRGLQTAGPGGGWATFGGVRFGQG